uniref:Transposase (Putative), gypsy type n=1 Tax=Tanacetum cinerariifolium TaxID=118510 RepID=A0A6L2LP95_TANCI|nr:hypothetical protein [Tanacetum cinerariifolium]
MDLLSFIRTADPTKVRVAERPSRPPKKLREDYGALGGASTAGKYRSSVSATPERKDKSLADFVIRLNLRTIGAPQRFLISSDSSHHFAANIAKAKVDSIVSDFLIGGIRDVVDPDSDLQKVYVPQWSATNGFGLDDSRICREMLDEFSPLKFFASVRGMDHDQLFTEFNAELLKVKDGKIESLKAQLLLKEAEAIEAIRLRDEVFKFEATEKSLQGEAGVKEQEVADLDAQVTAIKLQNDNLMDQISFVGLQEKVAAYEDFIGQLKKFQDKKWRKRRWLLTYGMELAIIKCLNSTEYLSALGAAISKAVEKGMQEGLSARITHGAKGRKLADVAAYNPSAEVDYLSALQRLQNVNFSLIVELKSNKDASVDTIMNLLRLDDALAERLGLTESQPHANQLMVPIYHSLDQSIVGAFALSLSLDVSHSRVRKIRENIASHVSALHGVFVPLSEPLSAVALEGMEGTSGSTHDTTTTLSVTCVSASTIPLISTDDYEVAYADGQRSASVDDETAAVGNINFF